MATWRFRLWLPALLALTGMLLVAAMHPSAADASCKRVKLRASKHRISEDSVIRVRGRVCKQLRGERRGVRIQERRKGKWRRAAWDRTRVNGKFRKRVRFQAKGRRVVRLRSAVRGRKSKIIKVTISPRECPLGRPDVPMTVAGCRVLASDTATADARSFWGNVECGRSLSSLDPSRAQILGANGDPHPTAVGTPQGDANYRRLTVLDGDNIWGERCELGRNDYNNGPTALYREGQHRTTFVSLRLPANFPLDANAWQTILQMKQAQPYADAQPLGVAFEFQAYRGRVRVDAFWEEKWSFPARLGVWTRYAIDGFYTKDPGRGWFQVSADLNADGDFDDPEERSPVVNGPTLAHEGSGLDGASIPSHLRTGVYHNASIPCPEPSGCSIEVDNVQVLSP